MGVNSDGTTLIDNGLFKNIGAVTWDTTAKTSGFTAVSSNGYFVNTTSGAITVTLPSSPSAGDVVGIKDYANTADTNNITIGRNGSNINGDAADYVISVEGLSAILVYIDSTQCWLITNSSQASDISLPPVFITATGGTITTSGDCKIHTFTGPGTFCVSAVADCASNNQISYIVVAGGGGGGYVRGGGGGAGGFREDKSPVTPYTASPLEGAGPITVTATSFPVTVGAGGPGGDRPGPCGQGSNSVFSTITSTGGGSSCGGNPGTGRPGGSGGGAHGRFAGGGGSGNTPPVSPSQGNNGGPANGATSGPDQYAGGGGGGAGATGSTNPNSTNGGAGGAGVATSISGSSVTRAGGGGGGSGPSGSGSGSNGGAGGSGGGGAGRGSSGGGSGPPTEGDDGTANTGGGAGGGGIATPSNIGFGGVGGSGIVIIRYKFQ